MKKQIALALISKALAEKNFGVGVKVFINTCRPASKFDILTLFFNVDNNKDQLTDGYKDDKGRWHFTTA